MRRLASSSSLHEPAPLLGNSSINVVYGSAYGLDRTFPRDTPPVLCRTANRRQHSFTRGGSKGRSWGRAPSQRSDPQTTFIECNWTSGMKI